MGPYRQLSGRASPATTDGRAPSWSMRLLDGHLRVRWPFERLLLDLSIGRSLILQHPWIEFTVKLSHVPDWAQNEGPNRWG